jgi:hypothetical protein
LIAAAGLPAGSAFAALAEHESCANVPVFEVPAQQPMGSDHTVQSSGGSAGLPYGLHDEAATAAKDSSELAALLHMHHFLAQEVRQGSAPAASERFAVRDALTLLDSVAGLDEHFPARLRALVYDTDEPPAHASWSVRWQAAAGASSSLQTPWVAVPGELLTPLRAALVQFQSLLETPRPAEVAPRPTSGPEPDSWAVLLAGVLGIGTIVRLRLLS